MKRTPPRNTQLFALPARPMQEIVIHGATCRLIRVFKHDFFAATCLYESAPAEEAPPPCRGAAPPSQVVVKLYRARSFCGLPMAWLGRLSREHERAVYLALRGVRGVPRWVGRVGRTGFAIEYVDAVPLDHLEEVPPGYFARMRKLLDAVHARGVAYVDANKRSNMLVGPDGGAHLIDFQIALRRRDDWPWPMRHPAARLVRYLQKKDLYHLCKHKRRLAPGELTEEEDRLSRKRSGWHRVHRRVTKLYRALRRRFLRRQYRRGELLSPTAELEDHRQPEKDTWRKP